MAGRITITWGLPRRPPAKGKVRWTFPAKPVRPYNPGYARGAVVVSNWSNGPQKIRIHGIVVAVDSPRVNPLVAVAIGDGPATGGYEPASRWKLASRRSRRGCVCPTCEFIASGKPHSVVGTIYA